MFERENASSLTFNSSGMTFVSSIVSTVFEMSIQTNTRRRTLIIRPPHSANHQPSQFICLWDHSKHHHHIQKKQQQTTPNALRIYNQITILIVSHRVASHSNSRPKFLMSNKISICWLLCCAVWMSHFMWHHVWWGIYLWIFHNHIIYIQNQHLHNLQVVLRRAVPELSTVSAECVLWLWCFGQRSRNGISGVRLRERD